MKQFNFIFIVNLVVAYCAPSDHGSAIISDSDNIAIQKISKIFSELQSLIDMHSGPSKLFESVLLRSVNQTCLLDRYKKHGMVQKIPDLAAPKKPLDIMVLIIFAKTCSSKTDYLIQYLFEAFMSYRFVLEAFIHEPEFKEFAEMMLCANIYAVNNKYIDPNVYKINNTLPANQEESCKIMVEKTEMEIEFIEKKYQQLFPKECTKQLVEDIKNIVFKFGLLVQIELNGEQEKELRVKFIQELRDDEDKIVSCVEKY